MTNIFNTNSIFEKITALTVMVGMVLLFLPANAFAQSFNEEINYQGKLADSNGSTVADGSYDITFRLYDASTGGTQLWDEVRSSSGGDGPAVSVSNGLFSVRLGRYDSLANVDFDQELWLSLEVESDGEMTPRKKLTSVPSAIEAENAQTVGGVASSSLFRSDQSDTQEATSSDTLMSVIQNGAGNVFEAMGAAVGLVVANDGDVGVGTSTPDEQLTVDGNTRVVDDLTVDGGDIVSSGNLDIGDNNNEVSLNNGALTVTSSGNVGIGSSTPTETLSVSGNIRGTGNIQIGGDEISDFTGSNLSVTSGTLNAATTTDTTLTEDETEGFIFDGDNTGTLSSGTLDFSSLSYSGTLSEPQIDESSLDTADLNNDAGFISDANDSVDGSELDNLFSQNGFLERTGSNTYQATSTIDISDDTNLNASGGASLSDDDISVNDVDTLSTGLTSGSIPFSDGSTLTEDNSNLYWDDANNQLGIGTSSPETAFEVVGTSTLNGDLVLNNPEALNATTTIKAADNDAEPSSLTVSAGSTNGNCGFLGCDGGNVLIEAGDGGGSGTAEGGNVTMRTGSGDAGPGDLFLSGVPENGTLGDGLVHLGWDPAANQTSNVNIGNSADPTEVELFGTFKTTQDTYLANSSGNVGIGTSSPTNLLDVEGAAAIGANYSGDQTAPTDGLLVEGDVGIGTTSPVSKLAVSGTTTADAVSVNGDEINNFTGTGLSVSSNALQVDDVDSQPTSLATGSVAFSDGSTLTEDNSNFFWDDTNNRLGLGTASPSKQLQVAGSANVAGTTTLATDGGGVGIGTENPDYALEVGFTGDEDNVNVITSANSYGLYSLENDQGVQGSLGVGGSNTSFFANKLYTTADNGYVINVGSGFSGDVFFEDQAVGINESSPQNSLDVSGATAIGSSYAGSNSAPSNGAIIEGNVGIGTTSPVSKLAVSGTTTADAVSVNGDEINNFTGTGLSVSSNALQVDDVDSQPTSLATGSVAFSDGSTLTEDNSNFFWDDTNNRLGIGTSSPDYQLDVAGTANVSNRIRMATSGPILIGRDHGASVGDESVAIGKGARSLEDSSGLFDNNHPRATVIGYEAGYNTSGDGSLTLTAQGYQAGRNNSGAGLQAFGNNAGQNNSGEGVVAIGGSAALENSGSDTVAIGGTAGYNNTGVNVTAVGDRSAEDNVGPDTTAIGRAAGRNNTGTNTTAIGEISGYNNTGEDATLIGGSAGFDNTGDDVTAVGLSAAVSNSFDSTIALGNYASTTAANQFVVGSDTNSEGEITEARIGANTQDSYPLIYANQTGLGLGTTSPSNRLQADGTANITGTTTLATGSGNVGIGTDNPVSRLEVAGESEAEIRLRGDDGVKFTMRHNFQPTGGTTLGAIDITAFDSVGTSEGASIDAVAEQTWGENYAPTSLRFSTTPDNSGTTNERLRITPAGNVGIGTTSPVSQLAVSGTTTADAVSVNGDEINDFTGTGLSVSSNALQVDDVDSQPTSLATGSVAFSDGSTLTEDNSNFFWDDTNNRLGIGTSSPDYQLDVAGTANVSNRIRMATSGPILIGDNHGASVGDQSVAIGKGARTLEDTSGIITGNDPRSTVVGFEAGNNTGDGVFGLTAQGYEAARNNSGFGVSAFGYNAALDNTGDFVTASGYFAAEGNTGTQLTALGFSSAQDNTGNQVTAIGEDVGKNNTADALSALGFVAAENNTGQQVSVLGSGSAQENTGNSLAALGYLAGQYNSQNSNTAVGANAIRNDTLDANNNLAAAGASSTALGYSALRNNEGDRTLGLGVQAGASNAGNDSLLLGYQAGQNNALDNQFIVQQANVNSNPLIQGDFDSGNVGVGTSSPTDTLSVSGTGNITGTTTLATNGGRVGVGTDSPNTPFHVVGNPNPDAVSNALSYVEATADNAGNNVNAARTYLDVNPGSDSSDSFDGSSILANATNRNSSNAEIIALNSNVRATDGDLGTAIAGQFNVQSYEFTGSGSTINDSYGVQVANPDVIGSTIQRAVGVSIADQTSAGANTNLLLGTTTIPSSNYSLYSSDSNPSYFAGNVGIGTTSPVTTSNASTTLSVNGNFFVGGDGTGTSTITDSLNVQRNLKVGTSSLLLDDSSITNTTGTLALQPNGNNNVGIGTTSASDQLTVAGTSTFTGQVNIDSLSPSTTLDVSGDINVSDGNAYQYAGSDFAFASTTQDATAVGIDAGASGITTNSSLFGYQAGQNNSGNDVTAIGYQAAKDNTGRGVTATGYKAAGSSTAVAVTANGYEAALNNTGDYVTASGYEAAQDNTGDYVTAIGNYAAGESTGRGVTAIGYLTAGQNTGNDVTASGYLAAANNTGNNVTASGYWAARQNDGNNVTASGYFAASVNTGKNLTAIGKRAADANTKDDVTALGSNAVRGDGITASNMGARVTGIGAEALRDNTGTSTTALGYNAGGSNTGDNSVLLGRGAGENNSTANQFILQQANVNATPLIQGDFGTGNVGIGTTSPVSKLAVSGTTTLSGAVKSGSGSLGAGADSTSVSMGENTTASGNNGATALGNFSEASGNNGATALGYFSKASGDDGATALGNFSEASGDYGATALGDFSEASGNNGATAMGLGTIASGGRGATAIGREIEAAGETSFAVGLNDQDGTVVSDDNTMSVMGGEVGIGTTSPVSKLAVSGTTTADAVSVNGDEISNFTGTGLSVSSNALQVDDVDSQPTSLATGSVAFSDGSTLTEDNSNFFWDDTNDRLGIGESNPQASLDVTNTTDTQPVLSASDDQDNELMRLTNGGDIGLGSASPDASIYVEDNTTSNNSGDYPNIQAENLSNSGTSLAGLTAVAGNGSVFGGITAAGVAETLTLYTFFSNPLRFNTDNTERARITSGGNFGIGTTSPVSRLAVSGTTTVDAVSVNGDEISDFTGTGLSVGSNSLQVDDVDSQPTSLATGSVAFSDGSTLTEDNSNFFWDDTNNRLGLGTASPSKQLQVAGSANVAGTTTLATDGGGVGIGTENPDYALEVGFTGDEDNVNVITSANSYGLYSLENDQGVQGSLGVGGSNASVFANTVYTTADNGYVINVGSGFSGDVFFEDQAVGINESSPQNSLDVSGATAIGSSYAGSNSAPSNGAIIEGNVGIGTTSPVSALAVSGTTTADAVSVNGDAINDFTGTGLSVNSNALQVDDVDSQPTSLATGSVAFSDGSSLTEDNGNFYWDDTNNQLGIGTSSPDYQLDVAGTANISNRIRMATSGPLLIGSNHASSTGSQSTAIGKYARALPDSTGTLSENQPRSTMVGYEAGKNSKNYSVTAVGAEAAKNNSGSYVTALGRYSADENSGGDVTTVGYLSGGSNTKDNLTAVGHSAGLNNTGSGVAVLGFGAGQNNTGSKLSAFGSGSAVNNSGSEVSAFGNASAFDNTGSNLASLGFSAARNNTKNNVTAIGANALRGDNINASNMGARAVGIGAEALRNSTGDDAIGIGYQAGNTNSYDSTIALGNYASTTAANQLVIGSDTNANGEITEARIGANTQDSYPLLYANRTGLGLGTTSPNNQLTVDGGADFTGNVGIGTTSPYAKLSVAGTSSAERFEATATSATSTFAGGISVNDGSFKVDQNTGQTDIDNLELGATTFGTNAGNISWTDLPVTADASAGVTQAYTAQIDGQSLLSVFSESDGSGGIQNKAVGIGTSSPVTTSNASTTLSVNGNFFVGGDGTGTSTIADNLNVQQKLKVGTSSLLLDDSSITNTSGDLALQPDGNNSVGIGTTSPDANLTIGSTAGQSQPIFSVASSTGTTLASITTDGVLELAYEGNNNEIAIGSGSNVDRSGVAIGKNANAKADSNPSMAIGNGAAAENGWSTAVGNSSDVIGFRGVAVGQDSSAAGNGSVALGENASAANEGIAIGGSASAGQNELVIGNNSGDTLIESAKIGVNGTNPFPLIYADTLGTGLGTTSPEAMLDITNATDTQPALVARDDTGSELARLTNGGNLGIGTNSPSSPLQINSSSGDSSFQLIDGSFTSDGAQRGLRVDVKSEASNSLSQTQYGIRSRIESDSAGPTNGTLAGISSGVLVNDGGEADEVVGGSFTNSFYNFGSPASVNVAKGVEILGFSAGTEVDFANYAVGLDVKSPTGATNGSTDVLIGSGSVPDGDYALYSSSTDQSYFNGSLGIGTTSATDSLSVSGTSNITGTTTLATNNGRVGIGTDSPNTPFHVVGNPNPDAVSNALSYVEATADNAGNNVNAARTYLNVKPGSDSNDSFDGSSILANATNRNASNAEVIALNPSVRATDGDLGTAIAGQFNVQSYDFGGGGSTINDSYGVQVANPDVIGSTIQRAAGVSIADQISAGANTNLLLGTTTIPSSNYSLYSSDANPSYFAGNVGVGTSSPSTQITVGGGGNLSFTGSGAQAAIGESQTIYNGTGQILIGNNATVGNASGTPSNGQIAIGDGANASIPEDPSGGVEGGNIAIGQNARADGKEAMAIGRGAQYIGSDSTGMAIGSGANAGSGNNPTAVGIGATAGGNQSTAFSNGATANGSFGVAIGQLANADGTASVGLGQNADATANSAIAIGRKSDADFQGSIGIGRDADPTAANQLKIGSSGYPIEEMLLGVQSSGDPLIYGSSTGVAIGTTSPSKKLTVETDKTFGGIRLNGTAADSQPEIGIENDAGNIGNLVMYGSNRDDIGTSNDLALNSFTGITLISNSDTGSGGSDPITFRAGGNATSSEDMRITPEGNVGIGTTSPDAKLEVAGTTTVRGALEAGKGQATGDGTSVAMGANDFSGNPPRATGKNGAVAIGKGVVASGASAAAFGTVSTASGDYATALNQDTTASGDASVAMGQGTEASGTDGALASGFGSIASGSSGATAMGLGTIASGGSGATAIGRGIEAAGETSFAVGLNNQVGTVVSDDNTMSVMGGEVGIGTTSPVSKLAVDGDITTTGLLDVDGTGTSTIESDIDIDGSIVPRTDNTDTLGTPNLQWKDVYIGPGSLYVNGQKVLQEQSQNIVVSADQDQTLQLQTSGTGDVNLNPTGSGQIQMKGNVEMSSGISFDSSDNSAVDFDDGLTGGNLKLAGNALSATNTNGSIEIAPDGTGNTYVTNGHFGIGTTTPATKLDVAGTTTSQGLNITDGGIEFADGSVQTTAASGGGGGAASSSGAIQFSDGSGGFLADDTNFLWDNANNRLGIGTNTPVSALDVAGTTTADAINIDGNEITSFAGSNLSVDSSGVLNASGGSGSPGGSDGQVQFNSSGSFTGSSNFFWDSINSRLGIGTNDPIADLDVNGNLSLSGTDRYINFGNATSSSGYGIRDNSGNLQFKDSGNSWTNFAAAGTSTPTFLKLTTSDSTTDMNTGSFTPVPFNTNAIDEADGLIDHSTTTNNTRISVDSDGYYRVTFNAGLETTVERPAPEFLIRKNGSTVLSDDLARHTYVRNSGGHSESSANFSTIVNLSAGDYIEVGGRFASGDSGEVTLDGNTSLTIERFVQGGPQGPQGPEGPEGAGATDIANDGSTVVTEVDKVNFGSNLSVLDDGGGNVTVSGASASIENVNGQTYTGSFIINSTGNKNITGLPFAPDQIEFKAALPVDAESVGAKAGDNSDDDSGFAGAMFGFARKSDGTQKAVVSGGSGNSINNIRFGSSNGNAIYAAYGDQNANDTGQITGSVSSWNSDGVTLNVSEYSRLSTATNGLVVQYTAYRSESIDGVVAGISDDGTEIAASSTDISFDSGLSVTDDGDGTVSIDSLWNSTSSDAYFTGGNVGIGTSTPDSKLTIADGSGSIVSIGRNLNSRATIASNANIRQQNALGCDVVADAQGLLTCAASDKNLKTDLGNIADPLDRLDQIEGKTFRFESDSGFGTSTRIGFTAQDVEQVFPELVRDTGEYKTLDYGNMTAVLAEAIKDLNKKVESQAASTGDTNTAPEETTASSTDTTTSSSTQQQVTTTSTSTDSSAASSSSTSTDTQTDSGVITTVTNWLSDQATTIKNGVVAAADGFFGTVTTEQLVIDSSPATSTANGDDKPDSSAGSGKIAKSATTTTIFNDRVATTSQVIVTMTGRHQGNHWINKKQDKFSVNMSEKQQATTTFDYIVIGVKDASAKEAMASSSASSTDDVAGTSTLQEENTKSSSSSPDLGPMIDPDTFGTDPEDQENETVRPESRSDDSSSTTASTTGQETSTSTDDTATSTDETASSTDKTVDAGSDTASSTDSTTDPTTETASSTDSTTDSSTASSTSNNSSEEESSGQADSTQDSATDESATDTASSTDSTSDTASSTDSTDTTDSTTDDISTTTDSTTGSDTTASSTDSTDDSTTDSQTASSTEGN